MPNRCSPNTLNCVYLNFFNYAVHSPLLFRQIVRIQRLSARAAILVSSVDLTLIQDGPPERKVFDLDDLTEK